MTAVVGQRQAKLDALVRIKEDREKRKRCDEDDSHYERVEGVKRSKIFNPEVIKVLEPKSPEEMAVKVIGRDREVMMIKAMIEQVGGGERPILAGIAQCGKMAIVRKLASQTAGLIVAINGLNYIVRTQDGESPLLAQIKENFQKDPDAILYIQHLDRLFNDPASKDVVSMLYSQKIPIIASLSMSVESEMARTITGSLQCYNASLFKVDDLPVEDAKRVILKKLKKHPLPAGVLLSEASFEFVFGLAQKFNQDTSLVVRTLNLIRRAANLVQANGKQEITIYDFSDCIPADLGIPREVLLESPVEIRDRVVKVLNAKVIGQQGAVNILASRVFAYKSGLLDGDKPWGCYFFVGSTGVGKTELAKQLASVLYDNEHSFIRLDMAEYAEEHSISRLFGAPPGYEGHEIGGQLTEALKKNPRRIIILDEFEKSHRTVQHAFLNVMGCGRLTDGRGITVNFKDCLIIMTSNLGAELLMNLARKKKLNETYIINTIKPLISSTISPEFCNRITRIVAFPPLPESDYPKVIELELTQRAAICLKSNIVLEWDQTIIDYLLRQEFDPSYGMRDLRRIVEQKTLQALEKHVLAGNPMEGKIKISAGENGLICA